MNILKNIKETFSITFLENDFAKGFKQGMGLKKDPQKEIAEYTRIQAKISAGIPLTQKERDSLTK